MGLRISTNLPSINAQRQLSDSQKVISKSYEQLASGDRINKAADDAAGLSISENMKGQIRSNRAAQRNAEDGLSMLQVAEGGLVESNNILVRLRELAIQASSDTVGDTERGFINKEVTQLTQEMDRITAATRFGDTNLLDGSADMFDFQVDTGNDAFKDRISFDPGRLDAKTSTLGVEGIDFSTKDGARSSLGAIDTAVTQVNEYRAEIGAVSNRLMSTSSNLKTSEENLSAANGRIRDTDIAGASADLAKNQVLQAASVSMLASANQTPNLALKLL